MMRIHTITAFVFACCILTGCSSDDTPPAGKSQGRPPALGPAEPVVVGPTATHPEYANWSRFKVGTQVKRKETLTSDQGDVVTLRSYKLVERTDDQIVLELQFHVTRNDGLVINNPPSKNVIKKQFQVPAGMTIEQFAKPDLNAKEVGEGKNIVLGATYNTKVFAWKNGTETGDMHIKAWFSDEIPGRIVRQEIKLPGKSGTAIDEVTDVTVVKD
jgi:hypothetical protein